MKKIMVTIATLAMAVLAGHAQGNAQTEGVPYFLPKTGIRLAVLENNVHTVRVGHVWRKVYETFQYPDAKIYRV